MSISMLKKTLLDYSFSPQNQLTLLIQNRRNAVKAKLTLSTYYYAVLLFISELMYFINHPLVLDHKDVFVRIAAAGKG